MLSLSISLALAALAAPSFAAGQRAVTPAALIPAISLPSVAAPALPSLSPSMTQAFPSLPQAAAIPSLPSIAPAAPQAAAAAAEIPASGGNVGPAAAHAPSARAEASAMVNNGHANGSPEAAQGATESSAARSAAGFDGSRSWQGLPVESFTLPNGLTVVVNSDHSAPMVAVSITYKVGSQDERPGRSGFAHLFEHLMAQGTKSLKPREISQLIASNGGARNAFTTRTNTTYHTLIPRGALDVVLWAEAERMHTLNVDARALALEQQVVLEEMRLRYDNAAYRRAQDQRMAETAFSRWENRHTTIGEAADVRDAHLQDVRDFYNAHYAPNNAVVALAGDITLEQAKALMTQYFGKIPAKPVPAPADLSEPAMLADKTTRVEDPNAKTPRVMAAWHGPARDSKDFWALTALSQMLTGDDENPLYQELVRKDPLALSVGTNFPWWTSHNMRRGNPDLFGIIATPRPGVAAAQLVAATRRLLERYGRAGPTDEELARAKTGLERAWVNDMDFLLDRAQLLSTYAANVGPVQNLWADLRALLSVTAQDVRDAVNRWIVGKPAAVVDVVPGTPLPPKVVANPSVPDATPRPEGDPRPSAQPTAAPAAPAIHAFTLSNGLNVLVVEDKKLPLMQVRLSLLGGRTSEGAGESGLSNAAAALLLKGAAGMTAEQFAQKLAAQGFELGASVGSEALRVDGAGLSRGADQVFSLLGQALSSPAYSDEELELWKQQALQRLKSLNNEPDFMAGEQLKRQLFAGHPYGMPYPQAAQLQAVAADALRRFHASRLAPQGATLVVAGDVDAAALKATLERAFAGWTGAAPQSALPAVPRNAPSPLTLVDRPGSTQANLVIAKALPVRSTDPDYLALQMAVQLLGGGDQGRLFLNLRVRNGYTYGSYASLDARSQTVLFTAEAQVRNEVAAPALAEMREEIARLRDQPVPAQELAAAKTLLMGRFITRLSSSDRFADWLAQMVKEGRDPKAELATFLARLEALTPEDVQRAARAYLDPAGMTTVVVGDAKAIGGPLGAPAAGNRGS